MASSQRSKTHAKKKKASKTGKNFDFECAYGCRESLWSRVKRMVKYFVPGQ